MKKVLKCDHCNHFVKEDEVETMTKHEKTCSFNPDNRSCWTCMHRYDEYGSEYCALKLPDIYEFSSEHGNCKGWEERFNEEHETPDQRSARLARKANII